MSAASKSGKSARISSGVAPSASISSTSFTRIRIPRMHGRPAHCWGLIVIRSTSRAYRNIKAFAQANFRGGRRVREAGASWTRPSDVQRVANAAPISGLLLDDRSGHHGAAGEGEAKHARASRADVCPNNQSGRITQDVLPFSERTQLAQRVRRLVPRSQSRAEQNSPTVNVGREPVVRKAWSS